jgi:hypothetical protein
MEKCEMQRAEKVFSGKDKSVRKCASNTQMQNALSLFVYWRQHPVINPVRMFNALSQ